MYAVLTFFLIFASVVSSKNCINQREVKHVIIDVDVGFDDYLAILLLLQEEATNKSVKIHAICCTYGLTEVDNVCINVLRLLKLTGRLDIPVYRGATHPLIIKTETPRFDGEDGMGDLTYNDTIDTSLISEAPSPIAMWKIVKEYPGKISLLTTAPLTNVGLAARLYDNFLTSLKDIWIMGGNYNGTGPLHLEGEATAEYNMYIDAEAAHIVLDKTPIPVYMFSWEACLVPQISYDDFYDYLGPRSPALDLLTKAVKNSPKTGDFFIGCDAYLTFSWLNPKSNILKSTDHTVNVILDDFSKKGQLNLDEDPEDTKVTFIEKFDMETFWEMVRSLTV